MTPEAQVGGPIALIHDGDMISIDIASRAINIEVEEAELQRRKQNWKAPPLKVNYHHK